MGKKEIIASPPSSRSEYSDSEFKFLSIIPDDNHTNFEIKKFFYL